MGYNPNLPHLQVGSKPFTNHLLTSWDIQVYDEFATLLVTKPFRQTLAISLGGCNYLEDHPSYNK